jgi:Ca-activated chloride channel family protein
MGATPGGAQDNGLADTQIQQGLVPRPEDFTVAGLLGEYDLPLADTACDKALCIQAAYGVAPILYQNKGAVFVQMGFSSGIDEATFTRSPLNLAVVVDRSGSMAGDKLAAVKLALNQLVDNLNADDRLALVLFDDRVDVIRPSAPVTDPLAIKTTIAGIAVRGATDMAAGLQAGISQVQTNAGLVSDRVMLFTDADANTGATDKAAFVGLATAAANQRIGLTLFGVGIDLNQDLVLAITQLRGGSYYFLSDADAIGTIFDSDFDFMVTPLAYDMVFRLDPSPGFAVTAVYGYPWQAGTGSVAISVPTVFLSRKHGAIVVRLDPSPATWPAGQPPLAELSLAYSAADSGESVQESFVASYTGTDLLSDSVVFYSQSAVRKTVDLVNTALSEAEASRLYYAYSTNEAVVLLVRTEDMLRAEGLYLADADLSNLADQVQSLETNMNSGASRNSTTSTPNGQYPAACSIAHSSRPAPMFLLGLIAFLLRVRRRTP